jgi:long-chain acyl-CoA synthetase
VYRSCPVVANICVYAAEDKAKPICIIVPGEPALKKVASENGISGDSIEELVHEKKLNAIILKQLQATGQKAGLASFEIVEGVVLADEEWTPQNVSLCKTMIC